MNRESISDILTPWCSKLVIPALAAGLLYMIIHSDRLVILSGIPLLVIIFFIKYNAAKPGSH